VEILTKDPFLVYSHPHFQGSQIINRFPARATQCRTEDPDHRRLCRLTTAIAIIKLAVVAQLIIGARIA
jgi:hypothetical protein